MKSQVKAAVSSILKKIPNDLWCHWILDIYLIKLRGIQQTHGQSCQAKVLFHKELFKLWNWLLWRDTETKKFYK